MAAKYQKRVLVSFDGTCPMNCRHCYTYDIGKDDLHRGIRELIDSIEGRCFDIIYLSQSYENFYDEQAGLELCEALFEKYRKDIFIITRSVLSNKTIGKLGELNRKMAVYGNCIYIAASLCADSSYTVSEDAMICPPPEKRLGNLERIHHAGIRTILLLRPLFPDCMVPVNEYLGLIRKARPYISAVISSGLIITDGILKRLGMQRADFSLLEAGDSEYLDNLGPCEAGYVDIEKELKILEIFCRITDVPFFRHSMPALNAVWKDTESRGQNLI